MSGARPAGFGLVVLVALGATGATLPEARAQVALELDFGLRPGLQDLADRADATSLHGHPVFGGAAFLGDYRRGDRWWRLGLRVLTQRAVAEFSRPDPHEVAYSATLILLDYEARIWTTSFVGARLDLGAGLAYFGDDYHEWCEDPFCGLPRLAWGLSPGIKVNLPLTAAFSLHASVRGVAYASDTAEIWPFRSGIVLVGGLEFYLPSRADDQEAEARLESSGGR